MNKLKDRLLEFFENEIIFSVSLILAIISCFFVKPSMNYLNYINWDTLILLFIIMFFVEVLKNLAVFEILVHRLFNRVGDTRALVLFLVFACFFSSVFITNDVSLIIFAPFTILALRKLDRVDLLVLAIALETIAANIGCMILPIGSPHNIILYTVSHIPFESFCLILLPYIIVSALFLVAMSYFVPNDTIHLPDMGEIEIDKKDFIKRCFLGIDYFLLLTFIVLFILIGNLENIPFINSLLSKGIVGNEVLFGIISSQIISNVPAAILLTTFSTNYKAIIIGINLGGLGTLIASMANLISYKILAKEFNELRRRYLLIFTVLNVVLLFILLGVYYLTF